MKLSVNVEVTRGAFPDRQGIGRLMRPLAERTAATVRDRTRRGLDVDGRAFKPLASGQPSTLERTGRMVASFQPRRVHSRGFTLAWASRGRARIQSPSRPAPAAPRVDRGARGRSTRSRRAGDGRICRRRHARSGVPPRQEHEPAPRVRRDGAAVRLEDAEGGIVIELGIGRGPERVEKRSYEALLVQAVEDHLGWSSCAASPWAR